MLVKTKGIVLRNTNYSESSVISKIYTSEMGIRTYLINGVRKPKSKITLAMLQPLNILELEVYEKPNANMQRIKELQCRPILSSISQDFRKRAVAMFITELLNACLMEEEGDAQLYEFLESEILQLEQGTEVSNFSLIFMMGLCREMGIEPQGKYSDETPYLDLQHAVFTSETTEDSLPANVSNVISEIKFNEGHKHLNIETSLRKDSLNGLILYYQHHLMRHREMKSLEILGEVMKAWHTV